MKLGKALKYFSGDVCRIIVVYKNEKGKKSYDWLYSGSVSDIPYWALDHKLCKKGGGIQVCEKLGKVPEAWDTGLIEEEYPYDDRPGIFFFIKEK